ncbi:hypothetical protein VCR15J2_390010 [Vibrio coralliirubri]|uniref:hypothetical protein n=1 Tax=Vibrio coralliirubri TaxID=1516159 RepID=UPI0006366593|nr:hypothetical protein [Vibrio coralliirubri]CDT52604.1 hypothetical protein VCR15J2_390010 [Vibrio coralliirubri]
MMKRLEERLTLMRGRYEAFLLGLKGVLASSLYDQSVMSPRSEDKLKARLEAVLHGAESDIVATVSESASQAKSLSFEIANKSYKEQSASIDSFEAFTEHLRAIERDTLMTLKFRMREDIQSLLRKYREMRLKISIRVHQKEGREDHILFSEREKLLMTFSPKSVDALGRGYDSVYTAERKLNWMMTTIQRQTMFFILMSLGAETAKIYNPGSDNDGDSVDLNRYFELEGSTFHFATKALLVV